MGNKCPSTQVSRITRQEAEAEQYLPYTDLFPSDTAAAIINEKLLAALLIFMFIRTYLPTLKKLNQVFSPNCSPRCF